MGREEQIEEREVLESIFPDEITDISETEFRIKVTLDIPGEEPTDDDSSHEPPHFLLSVRYPDDYPDAAPHLDILSSPSSPPHPHFNVGEDRDKLLADLADTVTENLGMAMVFTLYSSLKEAAEQLVQDRKDAAERAREEEQLAAEREENKKFHGTPVTPETFMKWREAFLKEMEEKRQREEEERLAELKKARIKEPVKLTGRQLWERGLAGKGEDLEDEEEGLADGVEQLKVEAV
ncbi:RWD-domain-containing protein [Trichoderma citrinoviride]|uniref:RWD-domain-containing protein n=1 Tax=Trichoderma citrinoviride TaxID=58853 RepID=A0A2T4BKW4_9HYPO|nr:RWD-domain-containing protein [Trichoderma citrinoviride]PTB69962.1 RWD-domain-containing protein [Trichoderma citrinoviride]